MIELYKSTQEISPYKEPLGTVLAKLQRCNDDLHEASDIPHQYSAPITQAITDALHHTQELINSIDAITENVNRAWPEFRKEHPVIMPRFFVIAEDGTVQETDAETYSKLPKPIDNIHIPTVEYEDYGAIPGTKLVSY